MVLHPWQSYHQRSWHSSLSQAAISSHTENVTIHSPKNLVHSSWLLKLDTEGASAASALGISRLLSLHLPAHLCRHPTAGFLPADIQVSLYPVAPRTGLHLAWSVSVVSFCSKMLFTGRSFTGKRTENKLFRAPICQKMTLLSALPAPLFLQPNCQKEKDFQGSCPACQAVGIRAVVETTKSVSTAFQDQCL